jgi:hypothetical protein
VSAHALVWWAILAGAVVVAGLIIAQLLRTYREVTRLGSRVDAYGDLPVVRALERAEADGRRIESAVDQLPALIERGTIAVATIRRGPFPIELAQAIGRVRAEIAEFRKFAAR